MAFSIKQWCPKTPLPTVNAKEESCLVSGQCHCFLNAQHKSAVIHNLSRLLYEKRWNKATYRILCNWSHIPKILIHYIYFKNLNHSKNSSSGDPEVLSEISPHTWTWGHTWDFSHLMAQQIRLVLKQLQHNFFKKHANIMTFFNSQLWWFLSINVP